MVGINRLIPFSMSFLSHCEMTQTVILDDMKHFLNNVYTQDRTKSIELNFQTHLLKDKAHQVEIYEVVKPVGSLWPRLYGLPKTHKDNVPVRLILSMVESVQHKLSKWLTVLLTTST